MNPYYQVFCGETSFQAAEPCHSTELVRRVLSSCLLYPLRSMVQQQKNKSCWLTPPFKTKPSLIIELGAIQYAQLQHDVINQCREAHIPVMSTEKMVARLSRKGTISRQELYNAIRETKDCVLLEKGPYLATAVKTLDYALKILKH